MKSVKKKYFKDYQNEQNLQSETPSAWKVLHSRPLLRDEKNVFEVSAGPRLNLNSFHHLLPIFLFFFFSCSRFFPLSLPLQPTQSDFILTNVMCVCVRVWGILCVLARARDCREGWFILMSAGRVVISEPQAGQQEAAKQLVIWCGLRYCSMGVKLCVSVFVCVWVRDMWSYKWDYLDQPPVYRKHWELWIPL